MVDETIGTAHCFGNALLEDSRSDMNLKPEEFGPENLSYAEGIYQDFLRDPASVTESWRAWFLESCPVWAGGTELGPQNTPTSLFGHDGTAGNCRDETDARSAAQMASLQDRVDQLVRAWRVRGHLVALIDPLGIPRPPQPELEYSYYGLTQADLSRTVSTRTILGAERMPLRDLIERLSDTYARSIGVQFMHISDLALKNWLQEQMEGTRNRLALSTAQQIRILTRLTDAVLFEDFLQKKFIGAKRFSLEGAESFIPLLDLALEHAGQQNIVEVVIGMPHRGRLNVLANLMGKSPRAIFREFDDHGDGASTRGDVKYHLGHTTWWTTSDGRRIHVSLAFNPSHLELVNPVALGRLRARQDQARDTWRARGMAILVHGDAAFAGEGIVQETLNMSALSGYSVGGTLHVVVNNQIGFTTSPEEGRSSTYATDVARLLDVPIFHVNGEDPEAVAQVVRLAMDFRRAYSRDVVIDMYAYRRRGHNEGDEPAFTQPVMVRAIDAKPSVREGYLDFLLKLGGITRAQADDIASARRLEFDRELDAARTDPLSSEQQEIHGRWTGYRGGPDADVPEPDTAVDPARLSGLLDTLSRVPADFHPHPKLLRLLEGRRDMALGQKALDWAAGEALAFATLAVDGTRARLSGQDVRRGTFSHRHAVLYDSIDGHVYQPLQNLAPGQAPVEVRNSPLSETGVLGFEYGYSLDSPDALVVWEAQFGDFVNVAQPIVDQFLASAEAKWNRLSGLVLLLPHGLEGQGPEHSSARIERFLQLAADDNLQVVQPTTPAQLFHVLRRQVVRPWRKPLVVMTPKSLLRHPKAISSLSELASGRFQRIIADDRPDGGTGTSRVLLCSGKVFYELHKARTQRGRDDVAILRLEQLVPLADATIAEALGRYAGAKAFWVQEEALNQGAAPFLGARFSAGIPGGLSLAGIVARPASASPATGSHHRHDIEQIDLIERAFES
jgi:2-oxoglutarate dehydrogenase E1 component